MMRFEKDKRVGETIKLNVFVYLAIIGIAFGLAARQCFAAPPRYLIAVACFLCAVYLILCLIRFLRFLKSWENTYLLLDGDTVRGYGVDPRNGTGAAFEIGREEVADASLQEIKLTGRTLLPGLTIRTASQTYHVLGIENIKTARSRLLPGDELF